MSEAEKDAYMSGYQMGIEAVRAEKSALNHHIDVLRAEVERLRKYARTLEVANLDVTARLQDYIGQYDPTDAFVSEVKAENDKLREQTELLVTLLRNDCDIEASWDGLRHFWSIELTEDGCLMRDRACKAEAENAKLRELVRDFDRCLTEAVRLAYIQGHMTIYDGTLLDSLHPRMCELGIEVDDGQQRDV